MENHRHFTELIPYALRSIPYILQSHVFKAYCALENLYVCKPHLPKEVWEHCVALIHRPHIAMHGFASVHEHGTRSCRIEGGCNFGCDVGTLAYACDNHFALRLEQRLNGARKVVVHRGGSLAECICRQFECTSPNGKVRWRIRAGI